MRYLQFYNEINIKNFDLSLKNAAVIKNENRKNTKPVINIIYFQSQIKLVKFQIILVKTISSLVESVLKISVNP